MAPKELFKSGPFKGVDVHDTFALAASALAGSNGRKALRRHRRLLATTRREHGSTSR